MGYDTGEVPSEALFKATAERLTDPEGQPWLTASPSA